MSLSNSDRKMQNFLELLLAPTSDSESESGSETDNDSNSDTDMLSD